MAINPERDKDCPGCDLSDVNLSGADLSIKGPYGELYYGKPLVGINLSGANLSGANLYRLVLSGANLEGADLTGANLYHADLEGAKLAGANLDGARLDWAINADFSGALNVPQRFSTNPLYLEDEDGSTLDSR